jgi:integrase
MHVMDALLEWTAYRSKLCNLGLVARSTVENQAAIAGKLIDALGSLELSALRKSHIELWMGERLRTCVPVTVRGEMNVLRQVLRWCVDEAHIVAVPRFPKLSVPSVESALPSDAAFLWVLANVPPHHSAALEFMMLTGLSPHELERVQAGDMTIDGDDLASGYRLGIGQRADFAVKQPSRRRWVPLNGRARSLWFEAAAGTGSPKFAPFPKVDAMQKAIRRAHLAAAEQTGQEVPGAAAVTPKLMRKWFASKVAGEQPEHVLQRLLGHAPGSPITRRHYVRSTEGQVADAVAGIRP